MANILGNLRWSDPAASKPFTYTTMKVVSYLLCILFLNVMMFCILMFGGIAVPIAIGLVALLWVATFIQSELR